jgi:hypothetical protein
MLILEGLLMIVGNVWKLTKHRKFQQNITTFFFLKKKSIPRLKMVMRSDKTNTGEGGKGKKRLLRRRVSSWWQQYCWKKATLQEYVEFFSLLSTSSTLSFKQFLTFKIWRIT